MSQGSGKKAEQTMISKMGKKEYHEWRKKIGSMGGKTVGKPKGFAAMSDEQRSEISRKGGEASRKPDRLRNWQKR